MSSDDRKVRLVSTALHSYGGRLIYAGQEFDVDAESVRALIASGVAKPITVPTATKRSYRRRDMKAEH